MANLIKDNILWKKHKPAATHFFKLNAVALVLLQQKNLPLMESAVINDLALQLEEKSFIAQDARFDTSTEEAVNTQTAEQIRGSENFFINETIAKEPTNVATTDNDNAIATEQTSDPLPSPEDAPPTPAEALNADNDGSEAATTTINTGSLSADNNLSASFGGLVLSPIQVEDVLTANAVAQEVQNANENLTDADPIDPVDPVDPIEPDPELSLDPIADMTIDENNLLFFVATTMTKDITPNELDFFISSEPYPNSGATISDVGLFQWTPPINTNMIPIPPSPPTVIQEGMDYSFEITVTGPDSLSDSQNFTVYANKFDNSIPGSSDNCTASYFYKITGTNAAETINGTARYDLIYGGDDDDIIYGMEGNDTIIGERGADMLFGNEGEDSFLFYDSNQGDDTIDGGPGDDTIYACSNNVIIGLQTFSSIEKITGNSNSNIRIQGTIDDNILNFSETQIADISYIDALAGADTITTSNLTSDVLYRGDTGNDIFNLSNTANAKLQYKNGNNGYDTFNGNIANDTTIITAEAYQSGANIGLSENFTNGVDIISSNTFSNVTVRGQSTDDNWDFSETSFNSIDEINSNSGADTITTSNKSFAQYRGAQDNDHFELSQTQGAEFLYQGSTVSNGFDTFNGNNGGDSITFKAVALANNTQIGLDDNYSSGVDEISGDTHNNVQVRGQNSGNTWDFSETAITNISEINSGRGADMVTTSNLSFAKYRGDRGNDHFELSQTQGAEFLYRGNTNNNGFDSFNGNNSGDSITFKAVALSNNTLIGLNNIYTNGVDEISGDTFNNVQVRGQNSSDTWDFSKTSFTNISVINPGRDADMVTTSDLSFAKYRGDRGNDHFELSQSQGAEFLYRGNTSNNGFDSFNGNNSGDSITFKAIALANNTQIGLNNNYSNGVDEIDGGTYNNVQVRGQTSSDTWDFSQTTFTNISLINPSRGADRVTTSDLSFAKYRGDRGNDHFELSQTQGAEFLYQGGTGNNGFDSFSGNTSGDSITFKAIALSNNTQIGLNNNYSNGVDEIDGDTYNNVQVRGQNSSDTWDFSQTTITNISEINSGRGVDMVTTSDLSFAKYRGDRGNDHFELSQITGADFLYRGSTTSNGFDTFSGNISNDGIDFTALALSNNTRIGIATGYTNGVDEFDGDGKNGVEVWGTSGNDVWDFSETTFTDIREIEARQGTNDITTSNASAATYRSINSGTDTYRLNSGASPSDLDTIVGFRSNLGDKLDVSQLNFTAPGPNNVNVGSYINLNYIGTGTEVRIDLNGTGTFGPGDTYVFLDNVNLTDPNEGWLEF